jgi:hypothetical protein
MKPEGQKMFMTKLLERPAKCEIKVSVWYPEEKQLNWLLGLKSFRVEIHSVVAAIINLFDGDETYASPTCVTLFFNDDDVELLRKHPELKLAYEKYDSNKTKKGGE